MKFGCALERVHSPRTSGIKIGDPGSDTVGGTGDLVQQRGNRLRLRFNRVERRRDQQATKRLRRNVQPPNESPENRGVLVVERNIDLVRCHSNILTPAALDVILSSTSLRATLRTRVARALSSPGALNSL